MPAGTTGDLIHTAEMRFWHLYHELAARGIVIPPDRSADIAALPIHQGGWWHLIDRNPAPRDHILTTGQVAAEVNAGRWIVRCPDCAGAQLAFENDPHFLCVDCGNQAIGGAWRPVSWPADRAEIEAVLLRRPDRETRSWRPDESVADLHRQNAEHGV